MRHLSESQSQIGDKKLHVTLTRRPMFYNLRASVTSSSVRCTLPEREGQFSEISTCADRAPRARSDVFRNEFKNCRIFLVWLAGIPLPLSSRWYMCRQNWKERAYIGRSCVSAREKKRESVCARLGTKRKRVWPRRERGRLREEKKEKAKKEGRRSREREKGGKGRIWRALFCRVITMKRRRYLKMKYRPCVKCTPRVISMRIRTFEKFGDQNQINDLPRRNWLTRRADLIISASVTGYAPGYASLRNFRLRRLIYPLAE